MLEFKLVSGKIYSLNPRTEKHGDNPVQAMDVKIQIGFENDVLDWIQPGLKQAMYYFDLKADPDLVDTARKDEGDYMPHLRFQKLLPILRFHEVIPVADIHLSWGIDGKEDVIISGEVNDFSAECQQGGTVLLKFRVQCHPTKEQVGELYTMNNNQIIISLERMVSKSLDLQGENGDETEDETGDEENS